MERQGPAHRGFSALKLRPTGSGRKSAGPQGFWPRGRGTAVKRSPGRRSRRLLRPRGARRLFKPRPVCRRTDPRFPPNQSVNGARNPGGSLSRLPEFGRFKVCRFGPGPALAPHRQRPVAFGTPGPGPGFASRRPKTDPALRRGQTALGPIPHSGFLWNETRPHGRPPNPGGFAPALTPPAAVTSDQRSFRFLEKPLSANPQGNDEKISQAQMAGKSFSILKK